MKVNMFIDGMNPAEALAVANLLAQVHAGRPADASGSGEVSARVPESKTGPQILAAEEPSGNVVGISPRRGPGRPPKASQPDKAAKVAASSVDPEPQGAGTSADPEPQGAEASEMESIPGRVSAPAPTAEPTPPIEEARAGALDMLSQLGLTDAPVDYVPPMTLEELKSELKAWFGRQKNPLDEKHALLCQSLLKKYEATRASEISEDRRRDFIKDLKAGGE